MRFCDIAVNLDDPMFRGLYHGKAHHSDDFDDVLSRSFSNGVERIIATGTDVKSSQSVLEISKKWPERVFSTAGLHPTCSLDEKEGTIEERCAAIDRIASEGKGVVVAIGELGLDYDRLHFASKEAQMACFEAQLTRVAARHRELPLFLHNRASTDDFCETLLRHRSCWTKGVVHSFTGTISELEKVLSIDGLMIGVNGCSLKTEENVAMVREIPVSRLLLETDAPWCGIKRTHAGHRFSHWQGPSEPVKKEKWVKGAVVRDRNEPCFVRSVCDVVAGIKGIEPEALAEQVWDNSMKLFF
jgi:TatD DNase family protein